MSPTRDHLEAAANWHVRLSAQTPSEAERHAWQSWYDQAAEHRAAWQRVERLKDLLAQAPPQATPALGTAQGAWRRRVLASVGLLAMAAALHQALPWLTETPTDWQATAPGERREVRLPDGGRLLLGPATRVGIAYGRGQRDIRLEQGSLQLQTGHDDQGRPLHVWARDGLVKPLGTRFTLVQDEQDSLVAVQEHAVEVRTAEAGQPLRVEAGQRLRFSRAGADRPAPAGFADEAWTRGVLVAMDQPLAEFLRAWERQTGQVVAADPALAGRRVSGSFRVDDAQRSLATLAEQQGLKLEPQGQGWRLVPR